MKRLRANRDAWLSLAALAVFLITWELLPALGLVKPLFSSSPSRVVGAAVWLFQHNFAADIGVSAVEFGLGFGLAAALGVPLGYLIGWSRRLNAIFDPFVQLLNSTPRVALAPLLIIWLGIGLASKVTVVFIGAFIPILINTRASVRYLPTPLVQAARIFGARDWQVFTTVALPASVPWIVAGLRLAIGHALVGVIIAELISSRAGVGYVINAASTSFQTDKVFVGVALLAGLGLLLSKALERLEAHFETWRPDAP